LSKGKPIPPPTHRRPISPEVFPRPGRKRTRSTLGQDDHWGVVTNLGVAFLGRPHAALSATGPIASDPGFQDDLNQEQRDVEDDLSFLRFYPVLSISLFYRF
jgi:hypothetical protein